MVASLSDYFSRCFVINLARRPDRLDKFCKELPADWPFRDIEVWPAVDGRIVQPAPWFRGGPGASACLRSHVAIAEQFLSTSKPGERCLVLEDDAYFVEGFAGKAQRFLDAVPADADSIYLGGQHVTRQPIQVNDYVCRGLDVQRTHALVWINNRYCVEMVKGLMSWTTHLDHWLSRQASNWKVYCPMDWLAGQSDTHSDIMNRREARRLWNWRLPEGQTVILLRAPQLVRQELARRGRCFFGAAIEPVSGQNLGLAKLFAVKGKPDLIGLSSWLGKAGSDALSKRPPQLLTVWHPHATLKALRQACQGNIVEVVADTVEDALAQLDEIQGRQNATAGD